MPISVHPKAVTDLKKVLYSPLTIVKYFEKGQPHACDYCMHKTARICPDICWVFLRQWAKYEVPPPHHSLYILKSPHTHPFVTGRVQTMPLEILEKASAVEILWNYATPLGNSKTKNQDPWNLLMNFSISPLETPLLI